MKQLLKIAILAGALALAVAPALALATQPSEPGNGHGKSNGPHYTPQTPAGEGTPPANKAFGFYCQSEPKVHVAGTPGTLFSACVKAHAKAAAHPNMSPKKACKEMTGKHVPKGEKGTPHSRCIHGVNEQRKKEREEAAA